MHPIGNYAQCPVMSHEYPMSRVSGRFAASRLVAKSRCRRYAAGRQIQSINYPMETFLSRGRCSLNWSVWVPFEDADFRGLHSGAGLYRIQISGEPALAYIGQTGRDLRQRLGDLRRDAAAEQMPFNGAGETAHMQKAGAGGTAVTCQPSP